MTINQVKCDGCGKAAGLAEGAITLLKPYDWEELRGKDLCPDCTKKVEEFIQSLKK